MSVPSPVLSGALLSCAAWLAVGACAGYQQAPGYELRSADRSKTAQAAVFQRTLPSEPYEEVGEIYAQPPVATSHAQRVEVLTAMQREATAAGCHGLIVRASFAGADPAAAPAFPARRELVRGVCIVFRDGEQVAARYRSRSLWSDAPAPRTPCAMDLACQRGVDRRFSAIRPVRTAQ